MQRKHIGFYIPVVAAIMLLGCRAGKDYRRPELPLPQQFGTIATADTGSMADITWKRFFSDPSLQRLIDRGIAGNYDLQLALKRIAAAQQSLREAKLGHLPELNAQVAAQSTRPSENSLSGLSIGSFLGKNHVEDYSAGLALSWEADIWGRIQRQKEAALADYLQGYEAAKAVQTRLISNIAQGFYNLLMLDDQLEIAQKSLALSDSVLGVTRLRKEAGEVTLLAAQQAEAQKQSMAALLPQLEQDITIQEHALNILTGDLPGKIDRRAKLAQVALPAGLSAGIPAALVGRRPDVRASELALIAANARAGVAQANMYPALNITATGGLNAFRISNWFSIPGALFGTIAGSLTQPVFQRRRLKTRLEIAKIEREQSVIRFRQAVLTAVGEVSDALVRAGKLEQEEQILSGRADTLALAVGNARLLFKSGLANYLEVIIAQDNSLQARLNLAGIRRQQLGAVVELYRSLGGGWK